MRETPDAPDRRLLDALRAHGRDAVCFQSLESGIAVFEDELGVVPFADTGSAWLAVGSPLADTASVPELARRFVAAARRAGRRVSFVGVEDLGLLGEVSSLPLGEQPIYDAATYPDRLAKKKSLREQLRRAKAKGVSIRRVGRDELSAGSPLRARVRELAVAWLASRRMEPLQFLVALEPFHAIDEHRYYVAERDGRVLAFASAIPIPVRNGYMLEDVLRDDDVPNGTTELLVDAVLRDLAPGAMLTLGLAPLTGDVPTWLRFLRDATRPLFDFVGLRAFKERMLPVRWDTVHLALPEGESALVHVVECLRAFAGGSFLRFGFLSLLRHPSGPPWTLVIPLVLWIAVRLTVAAVGGSDHFGSTASTVVAWSALDVVLAIALFRAAMRPRARVLAIAASVALVVAIRSVAHVVDVGFGVHPLDAILRGILLVAPLVGTSLLVLATVRRRALERGEHPPLELPHL